MSRKATTLSVAEVAWLAAALLAPLVFNPAGCNSFELPKSLVVQALALVAGLAVLVAPPNPEEGRALRGTVLFLLALASLAAATLLSTFLSTNLGLSLWGSAARQQGLLTLAAYLGLAAILATHLRTWPQAMRLLRVIAWGSIPVVVYGLLQAAGLDPLRWQTDAASPVLSTIGRANFLGSYLVLVCPLTFALARLSAPRWPLYLLLAGQSAVLLLTQSRSAWIGGGIAWLAFGLLWAITARHRRLALTALGLAAIAVFALVLLNAGLLPQAITKLPGIDRLAAVSDTSSGSSAARLTIWKSTLPLVAGRPWLGYGPETTELAFSAVYPSELVYYQGRNTVVDRAHNLWLDQALSGGAIGLISLVVVLVVFVRLIIRILGSARPTGEKWVAVAVTSAVAGHVADLQFTFDLTASALVFWLVLGLSAALERGLMPIEVVAQTQAPRYPRAASSLPAVVALLASVFLIAMLGVRPLAADVACLRGADLGRPATERLRAATTAIRLWPVQAEGWRRLAVIQGETGQFAAAERSFQTAVRMTPGDPNLRASLGDLYAQWSQLEPPRLEQAAAEYRLAIQMSPNMAGYYIALGAVLEQQGQDEAALAALQRATALDATNGTAFAYLAQLYRAAGRIAEADRAEEQAAKWGDGRRLR